MSWEIDVEEQLQEWERIDECPRLSLGIDSTLKNWRELTMHVFGKDSAAVKYWDDKIAEQGEDEWVLAEETQVLAMVAQLHVRGLETQNPLGKM